MREIVETCRVNALQRDAISSFVFLFNTVSPFSDMILGIWGCGKF